MKFIIRTMQLALACLIMGVPTASALKYSVGQYGVCQFSTCNITLTSDISIDMVIIPTSNEVKCSVDSHDISVSTGSSTGYTVSVNATNASAALSGNHGGSIEPLSAEPSTPAHLTANSWGYRIDGMHGFGAGPTPIGSSIPIPNAEFAGIPGSGSSQILKSTAVASGTPDSTSIHYGICVDSSAPSGFYNNSVIYSAVIN